MLADVARALPDARLTGFTVQSMVRRPHARELIVGASVDPLFGPVLLFGHGGTAVEVIADRAVALPPLNRVLAAELVSRTRVARLLGAYRDRPAAQLGAIHDVLVALSQMLADLPEIAELDINPLWADENGVIALDARIRVDAARPAGAAHFSIAPYPSELVETLDWHGEKIVVRPIRPEDEQQHRQFVLRLRPEDVRLRFFYSRRELPRSELARLTQIDYDREMALIAVQREGGARKEVAVCRYITLPDGKSCEFAIVVADEWQSRGLGARMMTRLMEVAAASGLETMVGYVATENTGMLELCAGLGFTIEAEPDDPHTRRVRRGLRGRPGRASSI
jgi:acetyltransferase